MSLNPGEHLEYPVPLDVTRDHIVRTLINSDMRYSATALATELHIDPSETAETLRALPSTPLITLSHEADVTYWRGNKPQVLRHLEVHGGAFELTFDGWGHVIAANIAFLGREQIRQADSELYAALKEHPIMQVKMPSRPDKGYLVVWGAWKKYQPDTMRTIEGENTVLFSEAATLYCMDTPGHVVQQDREAVIAGEPLSVGTEAVTVHKASGMFADITSKNPFATPEFLLRTSERILSEYRGMLPTEAAEALADRCFEKMLGYLAEKEFVTGAPGFLKYLRRAMHTNLVDFFRRYESRRLKDISLSLLQSRADAGLDLLSTGETVEDVMSREESEAALEWGVHVLVNEILAGTPLMQKQALIAVYGLEDEPGKTIKQIALETNRSPLLVSSTLYAAIRFARVRHAHLSMEWEELEQRRSEPYTLAPMFVAELGRISFIVLPEVNERSVADEAHQHGARRGTTSETSTSYDQDT